MARRYLVQVPVTIVVERSDALPMDVTGVEQSLFDIYRHPQWNGSPIGATDVIGTDGGSTVVNVAFPSIRVLEVRDADDAMVYDARKDDPRR